MVDTPRGQISVRVVQHVVQVFKCDIETAPTLRQNIRERIVFDSEIPKKQKLVMIYIVQVTYIIITHKIHLQTHARTRCMFTFSSKHGIK